MNFFINCLGLIYSNKSAFYYIKKKKNNNKQLLKTSVVKTARLFPPTSVQQSSVGD